MSKFKFYIVVLYRIITQHLYTIYAFLPIVLGKNLKICKSFGFTLNRCSQRETPKR